MIEAGRSRATVRYRRPHDFAGTGAKHTWCDTMSRVLKVHRSGYYSRLKNPQSRRTAENHRLLEEIRHAWEESDRSYGSPRIHKNLREVGPECGTNRVAKLMREHRIQAEFAPKRRRYRGAGPSCAVSTESAQKTIHG